MTPSAAKETRSAAAPSAQLSAGAVALYESKSGLMSHATTPAVSCGHRGVLWGAEFCRRSDPAAGPELILGLVLPRSGFAHADFGGGARGVRSHHDARRRRG